MSSDTESSPPAALTDSRLAALCAQTARQAFLDYQERFHEITRRARERFLARAWAESYADAAARLKLYSAVLNDLTSQIRDLMGDRLSDRSVWAAIKAVYSSLIAASSEWEIAESFFNSLTRRVFATEGRRSVDRVCGYGLRCTSDKFANGCAPTLFRPGFTGTAPANGDGSGRRRFR